MITRFAPSPTGPLHLGHAYSAMLAHDMAKATGGMFLLRIEDIDRTRARPEWETQIYEDLHWLGLSWPEPVMRQSERLSAYHEVIDQMWWDRLLYQCTCTRADILAALSAPQEGISYGPDGPIYPGTCRNRNQDRDHYPSPAPHEAVLRLDLQTYPVGLSPFQFHDDAKGDVHFSLEQLQTQVGDIIIGRKDMGTSYHLSAVLDDAMQGVTHVIRGEDLFEATQIHVALQKLLNLPTPTYHHHKLIRDGQGKRLAKRDDARAIRKYRDEGASPHDIRRMVGLPAV
ncbi:tRNA glutamyl-Q(34) synthetase GluQRS [Yoonia sp. 2307UL14-13]|uniref:tRNA glutamyl-Q(34) synthetase GluQRS n=1 Tax=Yoonia sp. 2307UL14-13 TaxID=3126506 RepID=UPI003094D1CC